jgi:hypothetical protein
MDGIQHKLIGIGVFHTFPDPGLTFVKELPCRLLVA